MFIFFYLIQTLKPAFKKKTIFLWMRFKNLRRKNLVFVNMQID